MAWLIKRRDVYYKGFRENGKDRYVSLQTGDETEAKKLLGQTETLTVAGLFDRYLHAADLKPRTIKLNRWSFKHIAGFYKNVPETVDGWRLRAFRDHLEANGLGSVSQALVLRDLRKVLRYSATMGLIKESMVPKFKIPKAEKVARFLSMEEEQRLEAATNNPELKLIVKLILQTGIRRSELLTMTREQVNFETNRLMIPGIKRQ